MAKFAQKPVPRSRRRSRDRAQGGAPRPRKAERAPHGDALSKSGADLV